MERPLRIGVEGCLVKAFRFRFVCENRSTKADTNLHERRRCSRGHRFEPFHQAASIVDSSGPNRALDHEWCGGMGHELMERGPIRKEHPRKVIDSVRLASRGHG